MLDSRSGKTDRMRLTIRFVNPPQCLLIIATSSVYQVRLTTDRASPRGAILYTLYQFVRASPGDCGLVRMYYIVTALGGCRQSLCGNTFQKIMPKFRVPQCYPRYIRDRSKYS